MNLASGSSLRAGKPGQRREAIGLEGLEGAASDGGRSGESSPPEGPGETAVKGRKKTTVSRGKGQGIDIKTTRNYPKG